MSVVEADPVVDVDPLVGLDPEGRVGDAVLAGAVGMVTERLEEELRVAAGQVNAVTARFLLLVAEYDRRDGWHSWGTRSLAQWLMWRCGIAPSTAREHVRVARRLRELPVVREAFARGELSYSKVRAVVGMATVATEEELVAMAKAATAAHLGRLAAHYRRIERLEGDDPDQDAERQRRYGLWWSTEEDGTVEVTVRMRPEDFEAFRGQLDARTAPPNSADGTAAQTISERRGDALVAMVGDAAAAPGEGETVAEVVIHVESATVAGEEGAPPAQLEGGSSLPMEVVWRMLCNGTVHLQGLDEHGRPVDLGFRKRTVSKALRRALMHRDRHCKFPGCGHGTHLHAHHIRFWPDGPTDLDNLVALCQHHHRLIHRKGYGLQALADGTLVFTRPDGQIIANQAPSMRAEPAEIEKAFETAGIDIHPDTADTHWDGDAMDYNLALTGIWYSNHPHHQN